MHGERSPHEELEPEVSADAIMTHVVLGTKILRDGRIPEPVVEFAYTHHGTQVVEFFWHKCKAAGNPRGLTQEYFRYPGMKPQTKETAILMLVDSIEAASRTIFPPEQKKFEEMIQRVVFMKLGSGQLDESGLTIEDLRIVTTRMSTTLVNLYHGRIKYPWQRDAAKEAGKEGAKDAEKTPVGPATPTAKEATKDGERASIDPTTPSAKDSVKDSAKESEKDAEKVSVGPATPSKVAEAGTQVSEPAPKTVRAAAPDDKTTSSA
jgi:hypothetical protein